MGDGRETAEIVALRALAWLVADAELVGLFMGQTGADAADLRAAARSPGMLLEVLEFVMQGDERVLAFCRAAELPPEAPAAARARLAGRGGTHWT